MDPGQVTSRYVYFLGALWNVFIFDKWEYAVVAYYAELEITLLRHHCYLDYGSKA